MRAACGGVDQQPVLVFDHAARRAAVHEHRTLEGAAAVGAPGHRDGGVAPGVEQQRRHVGAARGVERGDRVAGPGPPGVPAGGRRHARQRVRVPGLAAVGGPGVRDADRATVGVPPVVRHRHRDPVIERGDGDVRLDQRVRLRPGERGHVLLGGLVDGHHRGRRRRRGGGRGAGWSGGQAQRCGQSGGGRGRAQAQQPGPPPGTLDAGTGTRGLSSGQSSSHGALHGAGVVRPCCPGSPAVPRPVTGARAGRRPDARTAP